MKRAGVSQWLIGGGSVAPTRRVMRVSRRQLCVQGACSLFVGTSAPPQRPKTSDYSVKKPRNVAIVCVQ